MRKYYLYVDEHKKATILYLDEMKKLRVWTSENNRIRNHQRAHLFVEQVYEIETNDIETVHEDYPEYFI